VIEDTRRTTTPTRRTATIVGWKAAVFLACDRAQTFRSLAELAEVEAEGVSEDELETFLGRCTENELMVRSDRTWLNLAVHVPAREEARPRTRGRRTPTAGVA